MAALAFIFTLRSKSGGETAAEIHLESPVALKCVLTFALLFLAIQVLSTLAETPPRRLGLSGY